MRIALDAMGTDRHPEVEVQGAVQALREIPGDFELLLVGDRERIEAEVERAGEFPRERLGILHATQRIDQGESPATAVRRKLDSSIVVGLMLQKEGGADAFVSAGSTGAVMAASLFLLRPLPGVDRPPVAAVLPTAAQPLVLVDAGANVDCKPIHLLQFAHLGAIYARDVLCQPQPKVGLLNIGEEPEKGDELAVAAHHLLARSRLNFIGNIEGRDIIHGKSDVLVTDGFAGNVVLKFYEETAAFLYEVVSREAERTGARMDLKQAFSALDAEEYGGAPLLGVNGISIICHGGSSPRAIKNAIRMAIRSVDANVVGHMKRELSQLSQSDHGAEGSGIGRLAEGA